MSDNHSIWSQKGSPNLAKVAIFVLFLPIYGGKVPILASLGRAGHLSDKDRVIFIESTPKRRAALLQLKLMVDEAHRLREEDRLRDFAYQIADIDVAFYILDPRSCIIRSESELRDSWLFYRSKGRMAEESSSQPARERCFNFLDKQLQSITKQMLCFEDSLRRGFRSKMLSLDADYI